MAKFKVGDKVSSEENLEPIEKNLDDLEVGDVLIDEDDDGERTVLTPWMGKVIGVSDVNSSSIFDGWYTREEIEEYKFKIKQPTPSTTEVNGKKYKTEELEERLKELEPVEE